MTPHATTPNKSQRGYTGFDRESATYNQHKPRLLLEHEGKFFVVVAEQILGPYETFRDARRAGYEQFGHGPLYVKQVLAEEPVVQTSRNF